MSYQSHVALKRDDELAQAFGERFSLVPLSKMTGIPVGVLLQIEESIEQRGADPRVVAVIQQFQTPTARTILYDLFRQKPVARQDGPVKCTCAKYELNVSSADRHLQLTARIDFAKQVSLITGTKSQAIVTIQYILTQGDDVLKLKHQYTIGRDVHVAVDRRVSKLSAPHELITL